MDNLPIEIGDSFLISSDTEGTHLHIVIAEDRENPHGHVMLVYLTSVKIFDETTILEPGVHPFITKKSWVKYNNIKVKLRSELHSLITKRYEPLEQKYIDYIQNGLLKSKRASKEMKRLYSEWNKENVFRKMK